MTYLAGLTYRYKPIEIHYKKMLYICCLFTTLKFNPMKKQVHSLLFCVFVLGLSTIYAQIQNPGFEDWSYTTEYEQPVDMNTSNANNFLLGDAPNVTKVQGIDGFAVRLTGIRILNLLNFPGIVGTEELLTDGAEKVAYSGMPDGVEAVVRHNVQPGDTAKIVFIFFNQNVAINSGVIELTGVQNDFTQVSLDFPDFTTTPDEIYWAIVSSGTVVANVDSWIEVDHINFTGGAPQLANNGFNEWEDRGWEDPDDWYTTNKFTSTIFKIDGVSKSSDAYEGEWSLRIESSTDEQISIINIPGIFASSNPKLYEDGAHLSIATEGNNTLRGYYKYTPNGNEDHAAIWVIHNAPGNGGDDVGMPLPPTEEWTEFELIFPDGADSITINAGAGFDAEFEDFTNVGGSVLLLDNLSLDLSVSTSSAKPVSAAIQYLTESNTLIVDMETWYPGTEMLLFDIQGKILQRKALEQKYNTVLLKSLDSGIYIVKIKTDKGIASKKIFVR